MRGLLILAFALGCVLACSGSSAPHREWTSPDGRWLVTCDCKGTWQPSSCRITLSRRGDQTVLFTRHTNDRYIKAVWSSDSMRCVLLYAPDNANSYLWLFRVQGRDIAAEKLDYDEISDRIEAAVPEARRREPAITRSGIENIEWPSSEELRLHVIYNDVPVLVALTVMKPHSPVIRILTMRPTKRGEPLAPPPSNF